MIYHFYISYHRIKHIYKILKSDQLDIRNPPLINNTKQKNFFYKTKCPIISDVPLETKSNNINYKINLINFYLELLVTLYLVYCII